MKFKLWIDCDNAAFGHNPATEIARLLRESAIKVVRDRCVVGMGSKLHDINGNTVGGFGVESSQ